ncbi:MAG: Ion channel [Candidatus Saccharibacteria bacterium]|jgi:hypothetical protein|nr:Ion channel [Candidatus Saccharibacteria bacterium]
MSKSTPPLRRFTTNLVGAVRDPEIKGFAIFILLLLLAGTVYFALAEGWTFLDSFYHSAMLITTVGNSELVPVNPWSKLVSVAYVFIGLGSVLGFVALFAGHIHRRSRK